MNGISMTWHPSSLSADDNAPACCCARETRTRQPASGRVKFATVVCGRVIGLWLRRRLGGRSINVFENFRRAPAQQRISYLLAQSHRIAAPLLFAQNFRSIRVRHNCSQLQLAVGHLCKRADGNLTSATKFVQQRTLAGGRRPRCVIVEERQVLAHGNIALPNLDAESALSGRGTHETLREHFPYPLRFAEPREAGGSQNDGVVLTLLQFAYARIHIPPQRMNHKIGPHRLQLSLTPQAASAHACALREILDAFVLDRKKYIPRIDTGGHRNQLESRRQFSRQVLQAVHREINPPFRECLFNLLGEHALSTNFGEGNIGNFVASGFDDLDLDLMTTFAKQRRDVVGLPESKLRSAGTDPEVRHQFCAPGFPPLVAFCAALLASRNPKSLRTRSITVVASFDSRAAVLSVVIGVCMILLMMPRVSASTANSCSGVIVPRRPRTRSISAWRTVSRCSCKETIVGTTSSVCKRDWNLSTSSCTMASARSASVLRSAMCDETTCCKSSMSYTKMPSSLFMSGSISRGTAISIKNMGRFLRRLRNFSPCSLRKIACGAPVELITISAFGTVS